LVPQLVAVNVAMLMQYNAQEGTTSPIPVCAAAMPAAVRIAARNFIAKETLNVEEHESV
jgi:hypothetical protein